MNHCRAGIRVPVSLWSALTAVWLLGSPALAQLPDAPKVELLAISCKNAPAAEVARILTEVLGVKSGLSDARISVAERSNSILVFASVEEIAFVKRLISAVDVPSTQEPGREQQLRIFDLSRLEVDRGLEEALKVVFGGSPGPHGRFALDRQRNLVIAQGETKTLEMVEALVSRLEAAATKPTAATTPKPTEVQVRIVWLVSGMTPEDLPKPPPDLKDVVAELAKIGIAEPRLAAQTVIRATVNAPFQSSGSAELYDPCRLQISGTVVDRPGGAPSLQISLHATRDSAKGPRPVCQLETSLTAPPGHSVVLGVTPTEAMTSAFVVQVLPQPTPSAPRR